MSRTPDFFPELKPPRAKPRVLMHVSDAFGDCHSDDMIEFVRCRMQCMKCNAETDWMNFDTVTEAKRGIPCEKCNG